MISTRERNDLIHDTLTAKQPAREVSIPSLHLYSDPCLRVHAKSRKIREVGCVIGVRLILLSKTPNLEL